MKKILIASDSYKESLTGLEVASSIEKGFKKVFEQLEVTKIAMADGGEGTLDTLIENSGLQKVDTIVKDPLFRDISSYYGYDEKGKVAIVEMALASGLELLNHEEKNPMKTTTYGTGELIKSAIEKGAKKIIVTIGGSATNDAGIGMASALGYIFRDEQGEEVLPIGENLIKIKEIDHKNAIKPVDVEFEVACDVDNPLYGKEGAAYIYGKQKGANDQQIEELDLGLKNIATVFNQYRNIDFQQFKGSGAAGGIGTGLIFFLNAKLKSGVELVMNYLELDAKMQGCDLVVTGEGMMDYQSVNGKTPIGVATLAQKNNIPTIAVCGAIGKDANQVYSHNINAYYSPIQKVLTLEEAMTNTSQNLEAISENIARTIKIGINI